ncbi:sugar transferase [Nocardioides jejuensis]|uniref:Sugar transferase n=1 Tax=Nocardioides jejuensis TaxID=2502782 RepID=A0A4R1CFV4_9ACTN|nr:sugar transferase [Nocardioides jejuensis]TCJ30203.1 sugar transferase [Nocardioides jejuensis]
MPDPRGLSTRQRATKRAFDLVVGGVLLVLTAPLMAVAVVAARLDTRASGIFRQQRVGQDGHLFEVMKIRTMRSSSTHTTTVTTANDARITRLGAVFRKLKIDELPNLVNVVRGEMSLVGPRPDVPGYADALEGGDRVVLTVKPGITGPASVAFRHEEDLLASSADPELFNREVIWPEKVRINRDYVENWSLMSDVRCLVDTVRSVLATEESPA